jgi:hypothetical protein
MFRMNYIKYYTMMQIKYEAFTVRILLFILLVATVL